MYGQESRKKKKMTGETEQMLGRYWQISGLTFFLKTITTLDLDQSKLSYIQSSMSLSALNWGHGSIF